MYTNNKHDYNARCKVQSIKHSEAFKKTTSDMQEHYKLPPYT